MGIQNNGVRTTGRVVRKMFFVVDTSGSGTLSQGVGDATLTRNGTGDITLTFATAFATLLGVQVCAGSDSATNEYIANTVAASTSATAARVIVNDDGGTAADVTQLFVEVTGLDDPF